MNGQKISVYSECQSNMLLSMTVPVPVPDAVDRRGSHITTGSFSGSSQRIALAFSTPVYQ